MITPTVFAAESTISEKLAKRILDRLYDKELDAMDLASVVWKLKDWFVKNEFSKILEKSPDSVIDNVIDEMVAERERWKTRIDSPSVGFSEPHAWFFTALEDDLKGGKEFKEGDTVEIQILRRGEWKHPVYGDVKVDTKVMNDVVKHFKENKRGIDLAVDENHDPDHKALAWFTDVYKKGKDAVFASLKLTKRGAQLLSEGAYKYFSPEFALQYTDAESGENYSNLLLGGAFTNRPFFKGMQALLASEDGAEASDESLPGEIDTHALLFSNRNMFKYLDTLAQIAAAEKPAKALRDDLVRLYSELPEAERERADLKAKHEEALQKFSEEPDAPATPATPAPETTATAPATPPDKGTADAPPNGDAQPPATPPAPTAPAAPATATPATPVQATEGEMVTLQASEVQTLKNDQKKLAEMIRDARKRDLKDKFTTLQFSEKERPQSVVLPKDVDSLTEFAVSLSEQQAQQFIQIIENLRNIHAGEIGADGELVHGAGKYSEEQVQWFMDKMGMDREKAIKASEDAMKQGTAKLR